MTIVKRKPRARTPLEQLRSEIRDLQTTVLDLQSAVTRLANAFERTRVTVLLLGYSDPTHDPVYATCTFDLRRGEAHRHCWLLQRSVSPGAYLIAFNAILRSVVVGNRTASVYSSPLAGGPVVRLADPITPGIHVGFEIEAL